MEIYAVVIDSDPARELVNDDSLFTDKGAAQQACDDWNADIGVCETRLAIVVPFTVR